MFDGFYSLIVAAQHSLSLFAYQILTIIATAPIYYFLCSLILAYGLWRFRVFKHADFYDFLKSLLVFSGGMCTTTVILYYLGSLSIFPILLSVALLVWRQRQFEHLTEVLLAVVVAGLAIAQIGNSVSALSALFAGSVCNLCIGLLGVSAGVAMFLMYAVTMFKQYRTSYFGTPAQRVSFKNEISERRWRKSAKALGLTSEGSQEAFFEFKHWLKALKVFFKVDKPDIHNERLACLHNSLKALSSEDLDIFYAKLFNKNPLVEISTLKFDFGRDFPKDTQANYVIARCKLSLQLYLNQLNERPELQRYQAVIDQIESMNSALLTLGSHHHQAPEAKALHVFSERLHATYEAIKKDNKSVPDGQRTPTSVMNVPTATTTTANTLSDTSVTALKKLANLSSDNLAYALIDEGFMLISKILESVKIDMKEDKRLALKAQLLTHFNAKMLRAQNKVSPFSPSRDLFNAIGWINGLFVNPINVMVGGVILLIGLKASLFSITGSSVAIVACWFYAAGSAAALMVTKQLLTKLGAKLDRYFRSSKAERSDPHVAIFSLILCLPTVFAAVGNAFWSGRHLFSKLSLVVGQKSLADPVFQWMAVHLGVAASIVCGFFTLFAACVLYFNFTHKQVQNCLSGSEDGSFYAIIKSLFYAFSWRKLCSPVGVFTLISGAVFTSIYTYRLYVTLVNFALPVVAAKCITVIFAPLILANFSLSIFNQVNEAITLWPRFKASFRVRANELTHSQNGSLAHHRPMCRLSRASYLCVNTHEAASQDNAQRLKI